MKYEHANISAHSLAKKANLLQKTLKETQEKLEVTQARVQRQKKKIKTMHDQLTSLKDELIATEQQKILDHNFSGIAKKLIWSHIANAKVQPNLNCYSDEVKQFAVTLHYYSKGRWLIQSLKHLTKIPSWLNSCSCSMTSTIHTH